MEVRKEVVTILTQHHIGYMGPLTLYLYFKYGRAKKPQKHSRAMDKAPKHSEHSNGPSNQDVEKDASEHYGHHAEHSTSHAAHPASHGEHSDHAHAHDDSMTKDLEKNEAARDAPKEHKHDMHNMNGHHMHDMGGDRPMWATVFVGVSHCGAGCVLGDLVGEWLIYGTGAMIRGHDIWPCLLVDYAFALLFGIFFQYFSIAPMSGEYGPKTLVRAAKADILSLTAFEIGLFGWMIIYQVGIWDYKLEMNTWTVRSLVIRF